jgi:hypothetical protein
MKVIALIHDGDCADCSCIHIAVPDKMDVEREYQAFRRREDRAMFRFEDWLRERGAQDADVGEFDAY